MNCEKEIPSVSLKATVPVGELKQRGREWLKGGGGGKEQETRKGFVRYLDLKFFTGNEKRKRRKDITDNKRRALFISSPL